MNTIRIDHGSTRMIAHRGLSGIERENTNAAFVAAGNRSYFGIETDVHKTGDGQFVIIHDESTLRVSGGTVDLNVETSHLCSAQALILPDKDDLPRGDLRLPTLSEYIRICKKYEKTCVLELKNPFTREKIEEIIRIIRDHAYLEQVIFISFVLENCICLRELLPDQKIQWLTSQPIDEALIQTLCRYHLDLDTNYTYLTEAIVSKLHGCSVEVNCWTCDDAQAAEALCRMGVDYLTSNILE